MSTLPLIIDTDPGVDDFLAILLAYAAGLPIAGITTVFGNAGIEQTTRNALTIVEMLGMDAPVFQGAEKPLYKEKRLAESHGANGLGGFELPFLSRSLSKESSLEGMERIADDQERLWMIGLGPCTNITQALRIFSLRQKLEKLILMAGVFGEVGNVTSYAEFNAYNDPDALQAILQAGVMPVLIPADVCRRVTVSASDINGMAKGKIGGNIQRIADAYIRYYSTNAVYGGFEGGVMYDVLTVIYLLRPDLFRAHAVCVEVNCTDSERRGETTIKDGERPNCQLVIDVNATAAKTFFLTTIGQWSSPHS